MIRVNNGASVRRLAWKSLRANRARNRVAALAIALTALLFTSLFTILMSMNEGSQQADFRRVGGYAHGGFKYLTHEQYEDLRTEPTIKEYALRRALGMPLNAPFEKTHVEISYCDENDAKWMFLEPVEGQLPAEGTDEAAADLTVLDLLGVAPELGAKFSMTFDVDGHTTTQDFTLCGWWEHDAAIDACHVLVPESRVDAVLAEVGVDPAAPADRMTGRWELDVMFASSMHIEDDIYRILENHGYVSEDGNYEIAVGINWGYTGAKLADSIDPALLAASVALLLVIGLTGYLIIYNVFQISVSADVRHYGLLKTLGATGRQLRRVVRLQALALCAAGIPLGLILGWLIGGRITPYVVAQMDGMENVVSLDWRIFAFAALFALITVLLSCARPARMAARVSPVEAVRYVESDGPKRGRRRARKNSPFSMAVANMARSRRRTAATMLSLALAVVLLNATVSFTYSFSMDKFVSNMLPVDYIFGHANYFQVMKQFTNADDAIGEAAIMEFASQDGIRDYGRIYGMTQSVREFKPEEAYRESFGRSNSPETVDFLAAREERTPDGRISDYCEIYGMEDFAISKLNVIEGDPNLLNQPGYIAAVCFTDDYGKVLPDFHWTTVGDTVTIRYIDRFEVVDPETMLPYENPEAAISSGLPYLDRSAEYTDVEYEVCALVEVPTNISLRRAGTDQYILGAQNFLRDTECDTVMLCVADAEDAAKPALDAWLENYTANIDPSLDYESAATYAEEFIGFQRMFLLLGGALCAIVGLVGALNFFNATLTGILARRRELAMLQSIGMTGSQLKKMLIFEGFLQTVGALALSTALWVALFFPVSNLLEQIFWFFSPHFSMLPFAILAPIFALLGALVPLAVYRQAVRRTIVERLREAEA